jgi:uncharacterized GH25 family protein
MTRFVFSLAVVCCATSAFAHDYWLMPESFTPKADATVKTRLYVGEAFKPEQEIAYSAKKTSKLELVTAKKTVREFTGLSDGEKPFLPKLEVTGTAVLRVDRDWSSITLKADKFNAYLKEEGLGEILALRAKAGETNADGKERYRRCLKTIVFAGGEPDDTPTKPLGQIFELVPAKNPYAIQAGAELTVQALFERKPIGVLQVTAWHRDGDTLTTVTETTDKNGQVTLKLMKPGAWIVRAVHMRRVTEKPPLPDAEWESFWTSVTFELPRR